MNEKIIMFPGNERRNMTTRKSEKRRKRKAKYKGAVTYSMNDDGEKEIKSETVYITVYCSKLVCTRFLFSTLRGLVLPMFA